MIASSAGGLILAGRFHLPWPVVCRWVAAGMSVGLIGTAIATEPSAGGRGGTKPKSLRDAVAHPLAEFFVRRGGWVVLLFVLVFKLPENIANAMSLTFLLKIGMAKQDVGAIRQGLGVFLTIAGALAGGGLVRRWGVWRSLWIFGLLHSVSNLAFVAMAQIGPRYDAMVMAIAVENICIGLTTAGFTAWMMGQCDPRYSAFQFALLSGVMALGRVLANPLAGWMANELGWARFFAVSALCGIPGLLLLPWLRPRREAISDYSSNPLVPNVRSVI
jgi:PAT family beta-lactamase induction signal transducer AmpG